MLKILGIVLRVVVDVDSTNNNPAKVSVQTTRENPKPLVKNSHVFLRLFEESKMCFKCTDMYSTKEVRIILLKLFCLLFVCARKKKKDKKNFLLSFLRLRINIYT